MKVKVQELKGDALDWAVGLCQGRVDPDTKTFWNSRAIGTYHPTMLWEHSGPIIEEERICLTCEFTDGVADEMTWFAYAYGDDPIEDAYTALSSPLVAAMRCYVAKELGESVDIPHYLNP